MIFREYVFFLRLCKRWKWSSTIGKKIDLWQIRWTQITCKVSKLAPSWVSCNATNCSEKCQNGLLFWLTRDLTETLSSNCQTVILLSCQTIKLPNCQIAKRPNYLTAKKQILYTSFRDTYSSKPTNNSKRGAQELTGNKVASLGRV